MRADISTKGFDVLDKWGHACDLINHIDPKTFFCLRPRDDLVTFEPEPMPQARGVVDATAPVVLSSALNIVDPAAPAHQTFDFENFPLRRSTLRKLHRLVSTASWPKWGLLNDSSTVLLGADFDATGPRLAKNTDMYTKLVQEINGILSHAIKDPCFKWSTIVVEVNTDAVARSLPFATGLAFSFVHGKHTVARPLLPTRLSTRIRLFLIRLIASCRCHPSWVFAL